ncbi:MAG: O-antigen ligase family protein [Alteripontixanthobacter sp.]
MSGQAIQSAQSPRDMDAGDIDDGLRRVIRRGEESGSFARGVGWRDRARPWIWTLATALILVIGGANNTYPLPRGAAEAIAALLLGAAIASRHSAFGRPTASDWLVMAVPLVVLLQFVPLPPSLWTALPGRELVADMDRAIFGQPIWRPISLDIEATWRSLLFLIPPIAFYVAIRSGDEVRIRAILTGVVAALAIGAAMAFLQITGMRWAYPFEDGRADNFFAIGFFTNHNHQATFALMGLMALGGWIGLHRRRRRDPSSWEALGTPDMVLAAAAIVAALLVLLTASRAGLLLMALGLPAAALAWLAPQLGRSRKLLWPALGLIGLGAAAFLALPFLGDGQLGAIGERAALADDRRFEIWPQAVAAAQALMPAGSGFGTFRVAYEMFEPLDMVGMLYVNHAHNDYIELAIEGGIASLLLIAAFGWLWLRGTWTVWTAPLGRDALLARLGSVMLLMVMLHSLVDYPARTVTIAVLAGLAFGMMARNAALTPSRLATSGGSV